MLTSTSACPRVLQLTLAKPAELRIAWLDDLPNADTLCASVCLKGMHCSSTHAQEAMRGLKRMRIHSCVDEPGGHENGHEGVCAYRFLIDNYEKPWDGVFFLHGDVVTGHHGYQYHAFKEFLSRNEWPAWPPTRAQMRTEHCGCGHWGSLFNPFGPRDFWHMAITWWLGQMIAPREPTYAALADQWAASADCRADGSQRHSVCIRSSVGAWPLHNGTLSSPLGFMFAVDRASALQRSRRFLEAQYRICKVGVRVMPPGTHRAPVPARLPAPGFDYNPLVYGHVNERIPFFVFGHEFVERPMPDCLFEGDHASMNCTQPEVVAAGRAGHAAAAGHGTAEPPRDVQHRSNHTKAARVIDQDHLQAGGRRPSQRHNSSTLPALVPSVSWGCKPFDRNCGTSGR